MQASVSLKGVHAASQGIVALSHWQRQSNWYLSKLRARLGMS